jgi:hypothetical protein
MPEQGAYLLVKESLKTVKSQVNAVAKLLPGYVKGKRDVLCLRCRWRTRDYSEFLCGRF